jgi:hypothetical protein
MLIAAASPYIRGGEDDVDWNFERLNKPVKK